MNVPHLHLPHAAIPQGIPAVWHDGQTAAAHSVVLRLRKKTGEIGIFSSLEAAEPVAVWQLETAELLSDTSMLPPLRLAPRPDDGQRLVLQSPEATANFSVWFTSSHKWRRRALIRKWITGTMAAWAICVAFYLASPLLFQGVAELLPQPWEESLGKSSLESITSTLAFVPGVRGVMPDFAAKNDLDTLMHRLERGGGTDGYTFKITVLDADFVNAFALPGGYVVVTTGLILDCATPDELAGVLAHEMTHVTRHHGTARILRMYTWSFIGRVFGTSDSAAGKLGDLAVMMMNNSFDRDQEREADNLGAQRLVQAGISPAGMSDFFARLAKEHGGESNTMLSYFASHPDMEERRNTLTEMGKNWDKRNFTPALSSAAWQRLQAACPPVKTTDPKKKNTDDHPTTPARPKSAKPDIAPPTPAQPEPSTPDSLPEQPARPVPHHFPDASGGEQVSLPPPRQTLPLL